MIRILNREARTIAGAATIVAAFAFISRFIGFIRDRILAGTFGAGNTLDSYYAAFLVPDFLFSLLVVGALSASFIPLFTKHYRSFLNENRAWEMTNNVLNILAVAMLCFSIILILLAKPIAGLIAPGFSPAKQALTVDFMRVMFISNFLLAISVVFGSVLQSTKRFLIYSLAPILYNLGIIFGALILVPLFGELGLAWGVVIGALLHATIQIAAVVQLGFRYKFKFNLKDKDTRQIGMLMLPRTLGVAVNQINFFVMTIIATTLAAGSVTIFQFAYNIQFFAIGIIAVSYAVAAFPSLSEHASDGDKKHFAEAVSNTTRQILFFIIPASVLFLLLRAQIVRVVVGAGKFGWQETILTADTLAFFTLSFFAQGLVFLLARAFFAHRDTVTPLVAGLAATILNVVAALLFTREFGVVGLGISFSLASLVNVSLLWVMLRQKVGSLQETKIIRSLTIISIASIVCGVIIQAMKGVVVSVITIDTFFGVLSQGLIAGGVGLAAYFFVSYGLKSPEMLSFMKAMRKRLFKKYEPSEAVGIGKEQTGV